MDSDRIGRLAFSGSDNLHHLIECNYTEACTLSRFLALDAIRSDKSEDWYYYPCFAPLNPIGWDDISEDSAANKAETVKYFLANAGLAWDTSIPAGFALYDMTYRPVQGSSFLYCYNYFDHTYEHDPGPNLAYVDAASFLLACLCAESEHIPLGYIITDRQDIPTYERGLLSTLMLGHLNGLSKLSRVAAARETMLVMMQILRGAIDSFPDGVIHTWPHFCGTWPDVCLLEDPEVRYPFYASRAIITPLD